jgi:hypothetical protein
MSDDQLSFDADRNLLTLGERRLVFHCHHYNLFLQRTIEDGLGHASAQSIQIAAAMEATRAMLGTLFKEPAEATLAQKLQRANRLFGALGFGQANVDHLTVQGGRITLPTSHYAVGHKAKWGTARHPVCFFAVGFWMGVLSVAANLAPERLQGREIACSAASAAGCELEIEVL